MITSIRLENWKSYKEATLYIDKLSVLIGVNASGKSNALDALQMLNRSAAGSSLTSALQGDAVQTGLRGGLDWAARRPEPWFALNATCRLDDSLDSPEFEYRLECTLEDKKCEVSAEQLVRVKYKQRKSGVRQQIGQIKLFWTDPCHPGSPTITARLYNGTKGSPKQMGRSTSVLSQLVSQKLNREISEGVDNVLSTLRSIFILDPIPSHMRTYVPFAERLESDARNTAGVIAAQPDKYRAATEATLTEYVRRLPESQIDKVFVEAVGPFKSDAMLYCEEGRGSERFTVDTRGMSDGTLRFIAILTALLTRPSGSLLVIEEVDNGLHPSRANLLLDLLKELGTSHRVDVLVTTHNPALLDAMGNQMVPYITVAHRDHQNGDSALTLLEDVQQLPRLLAQGQVGAITSRGLLERALADTEEEALSGR